jgi:putative transposase
MNDNPNNKSNFQRRRSIRLQGYDYSQAGAYFITICAHNRECLFGEILGSCSVGAGFTPAPPMSARMELNEFGVIVRDEWIKSAAIRSEIELDEFVVMPNHFHGIVFLRRGDRLVAHNGDRPVAPTGRQPGPQTRSVGALMAGYKSAVTKRINENRRTSGMPVWQRNYYEHVIRNDEELNGIREYIMNNPLNWDLDENNPSSVANKGK